MLPQIEGMTIGFSPTLMSTHGYRPPLGVSVTCIIATLGIFKIGLRSCLHFHRSQSSVRPEEVFYWATLCVVRLVLTRTAMPGVCDIDFRLDLSV